MKNIDLFIFDSSLSFIGIVDDFSSVVYTSKMYGAGEITVKTDVTSENSHLFELDRYIICSTGEIYIIDGIDCDNGILTVLGSGALALFDRKVNLQRQFFTGNAGNTMCELARYAASVIPTGCSFEAVNLYFGDENISTYAGYESVYAAMCRIAETYSCGFSLVYSPNTKKFTFFTYGATDRSASQSANERLILSSDRENVLDEFYREDNSDYKNVAVVFGSEKEDGTRYMTTLDLRTDQSESAREVAVHAEKYRPSIFADDDNAYMNYLRELGRESLANHNILRTYYVCTDDESASLGDIATLYNPDLKMRIECIVSGIEIIVEDGHLSRNLIFGTYFPPEIKLSYSLPDF